MSDIPATPCTPPRSRTHRIVTATPPASSSVVSQFKTPQSHSKHKKPSSSTSSSSSSSSSHNLQKTPNHFTANAYRTPQKNHNPFMSSSKTTSSSSSSSAASLGGLTVPLMTPEKTPMKSPRRHKNASKDYISIDLSPMRLFTKKSSTVGSGRDLTLSVNQQLFSIFDLQDVHNQNVNESTTQEPRTPSKRIITDAVVQRWHNEHLAQIAEEVDAEEDDLETEIFREQLPNPFVEKKTITIINPFSKKPVKMANPFNPSYGTPKPLRGRVQPLPLREIDYSTHMELINPKTGARIVRELSESEKRIKPKKLDFSHLVDSANSDNKDDVDDDDDAPTDLDTPGTFTNLSSDDIVHKRRRLQFEVYEEGTR